MDVLSSSFLPHQIQKNNKFTFALKYIFEKIPTRSKLAHAIFGVTSNFMMSFKIDAGENLYGESIFCQSICQHCKMTKVVILEA